MNEKVKKEGVEWLKSAGTAIIVIVFLRTFFFTNYVVEGESMMPTLQDGNMLVVNKIGYTVGELKRFDVVVFHANEDEDYVKRVIGLPGDKITYKEDVLYINGRKVPEPYLKPYKEKLITGQLTEDFTTDTVPAGHVFVMGDNRLASYDSRQLGFIKSDKVVGKVNLRYWPVNEVDVKF